MDDKKTNDKKYYYVTVRLTKTEYDTLKWMADAEDRTRGGVLKNRIRARIDEYLKEQPGNGKTEQ